jgi:hypothetical protein
MQHDDRSEDSKELTNDVDLDQYDTPTNRVTINRLAVDELDAWLEQIRDRRLQTVKKLEAVARVKSDEVRLAAFIKYERALKAAQRALARLDEAEKKAEAAVHKCRLMAMAAELEVGQQEEESVDADD